MKCVGGLFGPRPLEAAFTSKVYEASLVLLKIVDDDGGRMRPARVGPAPTA